MKQGINMTVNRLPAKTWNWLKMNESRLTDVAIEKTGSLRVSITGSGIRQEMLSGGCPQWSRMETGMGPDMDRLLDGAEGEALLLEAESGQGSDALAVVEYACAAKDRCGSRLYLHAKSGSQLNVAVLYRSEGAGEALGALQTKILAEKDADVHLYMAQIMDDGALSLNDVGAVCEDGAGVELVRLDLGAGRLYAGGEAELRGKGSRFQAGIGYAGRRGQHMDMNYTVRHRGKKTESLMQVSGVLAEDSFKLFRGTIDFIPGCAGSKGTETEDVLLLGDPMVNQTVPLILCGEEDVEGNHGASIGRLDEQTLFYLASRGIPAEEAERMMARARVDALCGRIPSKEIQNQIQAFMGASEEDLEGGNLDGEL